MTLMQLLRWNSEEKLQNVTAIGGKNAHVPQEITDLLSLAF
jgi:hypothetical protein